MRSFSIRRIIRLNFLFLFLLNISAAESGGGSPSIILRVRPLPERHDQCHLCHIKKNEYFIPKAKQPKHEHADRKLQHGKLDISCHHCHDINNSNYLRSYSESEPASFENPSPVCIRCHRERYSDWLKGLHGKRIGGWNPKLQQWYSCVDCHNSHSVKFKAMKAFPSPKRRRLGRVKEHL